MSGRQCRGARGVKVGTPVTEGCSRNGESWRQWRVDPAMGETAKGRGQTRPWGEPEGEAPLEGRQPRTRGGSVSSPQFPCRSSDKNIVRSGVEHPVVPLSRVIVVPGDLDEALVQAEVMADAVLPALLVFPTMRPKKLLLSIAMPIISFLSIYL